MSNPGMTKPEAIDFKKEIEHLCRKRGVWVKTEESNKPDLSLIRIEMTIKVRQ